jgi:hypothetical protein
MIDVRRAVVADVEAVRRAVEALRPSGPAREGAGKALLDAAVKALPAGTPELLLDVMVDNAKAIGFYEAYGFGAPLTTPNRELGDELMWMRIGL